MQTAESLFNQVFRNFGIPEDIVSDRGPQFISRVWWAFFNLLGVSVSHIRISSIVQRPDWSENPGHLEVPPEFLPPEPTRLEPLPPMGQVPTEFTPSALHWSHPLPVRTRVPTPIVPLGWGAIGSSSRGLLVRREWEGLGLSTHPTPTGSPETKNPGWCRSAPPYQPGDKVWLSTRDIRLRLPCRKLSPQFISQLTIRRQINEVPYQLDLPPTYRTTPTFHVSLLKPHINPMSPSFP